MAELQMDKAGCGPEGGGRVVGGGGRVRGDGRAGCWCYRVVTDGAASAYPLLLAPPAEPAGGHGVAEDGGRGGVWLCPAQTLPRIGGADTVLPQPPCASGVLDISSAGGEDQVWAMPPRWYFASVGEARGGGREVAEADGGIGGWGDTKENRNYRHCVFASGGGCRRFRRSRIALGIGTGRGVETHSRLALLAERGTHVRSAKGGGAHWGLGFGGGRWVSAESGGIVNENVRSERRENQYEMRSDGNKRNKKAWGLGHGWGNGSTLSPQCSWTGRASAALNAAKELQKHAKWVGVGEWLYSEPAMLLDRESLGSPNRNPHERPAEGGGEPREDAGGTPKGRDTSAPAFFSRSSGVEGGVREDPGVEDPGAGRRAAGDGRDSGGGVGRGAVVGAGTGRVGAVWADSERRGDETRERVAGRRMKSGPVRGVDAERGWRTDAAARWSLEERLPSTEQLNLLRGVSCLRCGKGGAASKTVTGELSRVKAGFLEAIVEGTQGVGTGEWAARGGDKERCKGGGGGMQLAVSAVTRDGACWRSGSGPDQNLRTTSANISFTGLDVAEHGRVRNAGDTTLREMDRGVEDGIGGDGEFPAAHKRCPGKRESGGQHPTVVVIRELREDVREYFPCDRATELARRRSVAPLGSGDESLEDGSVELVHGPSVLEGGGLDKRGTHGNEELDSGAICGQDTAVGTHKPVVAGKLTEHGDMSIVSCSGGLAETIPQEFCNGWVEMRVGREPLRCGSTQ
ncbi:hypothetical protein C8J57DRAFT_1224181 [Mycena rebaudengoi]|nr:hypothetical protein C8J57DRAFT_1224181 [Mycena rebaudengoi]